MIPRLELTSSRWLRGAICLVAGALFPLGFAPYDLAIVPILSVTALFVIWQHSSPRAAAVYGWVFGLTMFGHGVWWIQVSVHQFGLPLYTFSITMTALFVAFIACYPALTGYLASRFITLSPVATLLIALPSAWLVMELARSWLFTGFPWLLVGYSHTDTFLGYLAPIIGVYGISLFATTIAGAFALLLCGVGRDRVIALFVVAACTLIGVAASGVSWTRANGAARPVALIQGAIPQAVKWSRAYREPSLQLYQTLSEPYWSGSLIIWPETAIAAFSDEVPETIATLDRLAGRADTDLLVGVATREEHVSGRYYNSVVQLGAGEGRYDKRHLVPFGEYLPFDDFIRPVTNFLHIPMSDFSAGTDAQPLIEVDGIPIGVSICYEDAYQGEVSRALPDAQVLVNVSNDAWFGDSIAPHQHLQIARMRAMELRRYLLRATNTGISAIIDHHGRVLAVSEQFEPATVAGSYVPHVGETPVARYGYGIPLAYVFVLVVLRAFTLRFRRRSSGYAAAD